jgi:hypothetical protein
MAKNIVDAIPPRKRIISRAEARARGWKFYFTGVACPSGHISIRYASGKGGCKECLCNPILTVAQMRMRKTCGHGLKVRLLGVDKSPT